MIRIIEPILAAYAQDRHDGERFGDFVIRAGVVKPTSAGNRFHADLKLITT